MPPIQNRPLRAVACLVLLGASVETQAFRDDAFQPDAEPPRPSSIGEADTWSEGRVSLPPWPQDGDLQEFSPEGISGGFRFYIDARNLAIDPAGGVVRYTLVAESPAGQRNVSFEGIRCTIQGGYKVYAYGVNGRFSPAEPSDWLPPTARGTEAYRDDLWRHRFCIYRETRPLPKRDILRALAGQGSGRDARGLLGE